MLHHSRQGSQSTECVRSLEYFCFSGDHTESVQLEYNPEETSYRNLLKSFWTNHNTTTCQKNQYMSAIFYHDEEQKKEAELTKADHQKNVKSPIVTKILPAKTFYDAEKYVNFAVCQYFLISKVINSIRKCFILISVTTKSTCCVNVQMYWQALD